MQLHEHQAYWRSNCQTLGFTEATTVSEHIKPGEGQIMESSAGNLGYMSGVWHSTWGAVQLHGELTPGLTPSPHLQQAHSLFHAFIQSCIQLFARSLAHSLPHSLIHPFIRHVSSPRVRYT
jgi:hypothetical protein